MDIKFNSPNQPFTTQRMVSDEFQNAQIERRASSSAAIVEDEALRREKAAGLAEFLANHPEIESK